MLLHDLGPEPATGAELADLLEDVAEDVEVVGKPSGELVHRQATLDGVVRVGLGNAEGIGHFLRWRRTGLPNVVAADRHRRVLRCVRGAVFDGVANQADRGFHRKNPGAPANEFLEDVVLRGAAQFLDVVAALFGHRQVHRDQDRGCAVDG